MVLGPGHTVVDQCPTVTKKSRCGIAPPARTRVPGGRKGYEERKGARSVKTTGTEME